MFKWLLIATVIYWWVWYFLAVNSSYKPISEQIDVKTMSLKFPDYILETRNVCSWICTNYSTNNSSSWWWGGSSWGWGK